MTYPGESWFSEQVSCKKEVGDMRDKFEVFALVRCEAIADGFCCMQCQKDRGRYRRDSTTSELCWIRKSDEDEDLHLSVGVDGYTIH